MTREQKKVLLAVARNSIAESFGEGTGEPRERAERDRDLNVVGPGAFVTLRKGGNLRGCIGFLVGNMPLFRLVSLLAKESAFHDYRFPPLEKEELALCDIEISVLSVPKRIDTLDDFIPKRDGIILTVRGRRAVFLPQVATEQNWGREEMMRNLSLKAGLPPDAYREAGAEYETFTADVFGETDEGM